MSEFYERYLLSPHWMRVRADAIRQSPRCQRCGVSGSERPDAGATMHVHHRSYSNIWREKPGDIEVLCRVCHMALHNACETQSAQDKLWCLGCDQPCGHGAGDGRGYCTECGAGPYCRECLKKHELLAHTEEGQEIRKRGEESRERDFESTRSLMRKSEAERYHAAG